MTAVDQPVLAVPAPKEEPSALRVRLKFLVR